MAKKSKAPIRLFSVRDLADAITYLVLLIVGWILPVRTLWSAVSPLAIVHSFIGHASLARRAWLAEAIARTAYRGTARSFDIRRMQLTYHEIVLQLHLLCRRRVRLPIDLIGREHIDAELSHGRGVILLIANLAYCNFVAKAALSEAGFRVSHLSVPGHASSDTRFGRQFITRAHTEVENRYLRERVVMAPDNIVGSLKSLERRLCENGVVSITGVSGLSAIQMPFLGGTTGLGRAAPGLSRLAKTSILPVFTLPSDSGEFTVRIGAPLKTNRTGAQFEKALAAAFGARLEEIVREHPTRWLGWPEWDHAGVKAVSTSLAVEPNFRSQERTA